MKYSWCLYRKHKFNTITNVSMIALILILFVCTTHLVFLRNKNTISRNFRMNSLYHYQKMDTIDHLVPEHDDDEFIYQEKERVLIDKQNIDNGLMATDSHSSYSGATWNQKISDNEVFHDQRHFLDKAIHTKVGGNDPTDSSANFKHDAKTYGPNNEEKPRSKPHSLQQNHNNMVISRHHSATSRANTGSSSASKQNKVNTMTRNSRPKTEIPNLHNISVSSEINSKQNAGMKTGILSPKVKKLTTESDVIVNIPRSKTDVMKSNPINDVLITRLTRDLKSKINDYLPTDIIEKSTPCTNMTKPNNGWHGNKKNCLLRVRLPTNFEDRITQLLKSVNSTPSMSQENSNAINGMSDSVTGSSDIILITATSSQNSKDTMTQLDNLKLNVLPYLRNVTFIIYDLGLSYYQRKEMSEKCQCRIIRFPFEKFPKHVSNLKSSAWRPLIIKAHLIRSNILIWFDSSTRFLNHDPSHLSELIRRVRVRGFVSGSIKSRLPQTTSRKTFKFFGDESCVYTNHSALSSGVLMFSNEPLITLALVHPWAACALDEDCSDCHADSKAFTKTAAPVCADMSSKSKEPGPCYRPDVSALGIIIAKLFQEKSHHVVLQDIDRFIQIKDRQ